MKRRTAIRNIVIIGAGAALLPACQETGKSAIVYKNLPLDAAQQDMLAELSETILPKTKDFIGAKDLKAHEFVLTMVNDCNSPENQATFMQGLKDFSAHFHKNSGEAFEKATQKQRIDYLKKLEENKDGKIPEISFYRSVKRYTVQAFTSSKEYMTDIRKYKLVPGSKFKGCVSVKAVV